MAIVSDSGTEDPGFESPTGYIKYIKGNNTERIALRPPAPTQGQKIVGSNPCSRWIYLHTRLTQHWYKTR
jgi:hypothetical protein